MAKIAIILWLITLVFFFIPMPILAILAIYYIVIPILLLRFKPEWIDKMP